VKPGLGAITLSLVKRDRLPKEMQRDIRRALINAELVD